MTKTQVRTVRTRRGTREYTYLGCPLTRNRAPWCFRLCRPDAEGKGECGRVAPHGLKSETQRAIKEHRQKLRDAHIEALESAYLASPENELYDPGVRISGGEAEIVLPVQERFRVGGGSTLAAGLCFKAMNDSAHLAVSSVVEDGAVSTVEFSVQFTDVTACGELHARSLFVGMSAERYLTESVLTDAEGREIGRAKGVFAQATGA